MERGIRRLLRDIEALGRASEDRVPAWERLEREVGPLTARKLVPATARSSVDRSPPRRRLSGAREVIELPVRDYPLPERPPRLAV